MNIIKYLSALLCLTALICGCQKEQKEEEQTPPEAVSEFQLEYLKNCLLITDENGETSILRGVALDTADPTVISLSVEDVEEAEEKFHELFYDTPYSEISSTYTLNDNRGSARFFVNDPPIDGIVAYAEFNIPEIPQVTKINYVLESSWPENAAARGTYRKGNSYQMKGWDKTTKDQLGGASKDKLEWFVCLREDKNGNPALLVAITDDTYHLRWYWYERDSGMYERFPGRSRAQSISKLIRAEWDNYCNIYNKNVPGALTANQNYWIDDGSDYFFARFRCAINLYNGNITDYDTQYGSKHCRALMFREEKTKK